MAEKSETEEKKIIFSKEFGIILFTSCIIAIVPLLPSYLMINDIFDFPQNIKYWMIIQLVIVGILAILYIIVMILRSKIKVDHDGWEGWKIIFFNNSIMQYLNNYIASLRANYNLFSIP